jgi:hypothetical protein
VLQAVAKKYERCPECSMEYKPDQLAKKVIEENFVAVMVRDITLSVI